MVSFSLSRSFSFQRSIRLFSNAALKEKHYSTNEDALLERIESLNEIVNQFKATIPFAVAYGSSVFPQNKSKTNGSVRIYIQCVF